MKPELTPRASLFSRLRTETSEQHAALERIVPLMSPQVSRGDYVRFLTLSWGFHSPVEHRLRRVDGLASVITDLEERWKTARLEQDLAALGVDTSGFSLAASRGRSPLAPEEPAEVPAIHSLDRALGVMYVLEGSTLGGQYLRRHLTDALPDVMARASRFLDCYGNHTGSMWKAFQREADAVSDRLDVDAVVDAARESFTVMMAWFAAPTAGAEAETARSA